MDEFHRVLGVLRSSVAVCDIDHIADCAPVVHDQHVLEFAQVDGEVIHEEFAGVLVLLQGQMLLCLAMRLDIVFGIWFIERVAPLEPCLVTLVPILESVEEPVLDLLLECHLFLFHLFMLY